MPWYEARMNARHRILVVDDDPDIRLLIRSLLERAGYEVQEAEDGKAALRAFYENPPALVLLDVTMPEMDGFQTLERLRDLSDVPVMMLTARSQELEKVRGLAAGADDYVAKPFGRQELLARVQALLRRSGGRSEMVEAYADDHVEIDYAQRKVVVDGREVQLTPLEFKLLAAFVQNQGQVLSRDQLLEIVWGDPYGVSGDQVKLYVGYLRKKLMPDSPDTTPIETVRGFGYRYAKSSSYGVFELFEAKGLEQVDVGARVDPALPVRVLHAGREQHDLDVRERHVCAERLDDGDPAHARHHHVEDRDCRSLGFRRSERGGTVAGSAHVVTGTRQPQCDEREDVLVVVGAEDDRTVAHCSAGISTTNVAPFPSSLETPIRPPCASTIAFEM